MATPTNSTENERRLVVLCRRLLRQNESLHSHNRELHAHLRRWHAAFRRLGLEYRALRAAFDQAEWEHGVKEEAADVLLGAALDDSAQGTASGATR